MLILSATFSLSPDGLIEPLDPQPPVRIVDEFFGEPDASSVRTESDIVREKPLVDIVVLGTAIAPVGKPVRQLEVGLEVGDIRKRLRVSGDRRRLMGGIYGRPRPFARMPIVYERAFGGMDDGEGRRRSARAFLPNPVGFGYKGISPRDPAIESDAPNVESIAGTRKERRSQAAGLGVVARGWSPRRELAGTYDDAWLETQWPLPPRDYDPLHNQCAPGDQQSHSIRGGEPVRIVGMTESGEWSFVLPTLDVPARLSFDDRDEVVDPRLDTIVIDADTRTVAMSCRLAVPVRRLEPALREIVIGHCTPGWHRAREQRKLYVDWSGANGTDRSRPTYR